MIDNDEKSWGNSESQTTKPHVATKPKGSRPGTSRKQAVNQTLSCAECRRLKLRCDRVFPCGSCQKRGIAELCPEGSLPTRNKPVTSSTDKEQLYQSLSELRGRVMELEKALEVAHARFSSEPHPLLSDESYMRKALSRRRKASNGPADDEEHDESDDGETLDDALGSLNVGGDGQARYFGRSACVERLFRYQNISALSPTSEANILVSAEVAMIYQSFPFLTIGEATGLVQERIWRHLPPLQRAQALRQSYCRQVYYITDVVPQDSWFEDLFSRVYNGAQPMDTPLASFSESGVRIDELALLFAYFAMGALVDLELTPFNYEAEAYACLSRSALTSMNVLKNATIITIEALVLLGYFEAMWGEIIGSGDAWIITALATKLAQVIGLHRNTMKFGLEPVDVKRRSKVYWELYTLELIESLSHGRPSTFSLVPADVAMPACSDLKNDMHGFRYRLAAECLAPLNKQAFGLKIPMYTAVIELDRKIRKLCGDLGIGAPEQGTTFNGLDESEAMQSYMKLVYRESTLLYLHRTFFARAVATNPGDPQHTKYGLSVSGAYDSAMTLVQALGDLFQRYPAPSSRALLCWNHTLCSVFILGSIATRCPGSRLAPLAAKRLHDINELYQRASTYGGRASADGPIVSRMTEKSDCATQNYAMEHNRPSRLSKTSPSTGNYVGKRDPDEDGDDELALLGGYTRMNKTSKGSPPPVSSIGQAQPGYSPGQRNASPGTTDPGSQPEIGLIFSDQARQWDLSNSAILEYQHLARHDDQGSSPSGDTTDLHLSSGGSASSGMSPVPSIVVPVQHEPYIHNDPPLKPFDPSQSEMEMQYRGIPGYDYTNGVPQQTMGIAGYDPDIVRVGRPFGAYQQPGHNGPGPQQHVTYAPMDVSAAPEPQDWNFLDDWYGHVFQLDVIPPDYGQTTT